MKTKHHYSEPLKANVTQPVSTSIFLGKPFNFFHKISKLAISTDKLPMKQINILVTYRQKHNISFNHNSNTGYMHYCQINTPHYSV